MICDKIENLKKYIGDDNLLNSILNLIGEIKEARRYESETAPIFANVGEYTTAPYSDAAFENHHRNIDLQYMMSGSEKIFVESICEEKRKTDYDQSGDFELFYENGNITEVTVKTGYFIILLPGEAHYTSVFTQKPEQVRKAVVKIPADKYLKLFK